MRDKLPIIISGKSITIYVDGRAHTVSKEDMRYERIIQAIKSEDWDAVATISNTANSVKKFGGGKLEIKGDHVYYNGEELHNHAVDRILSFINDGIDPRPMMNFLEKLMQNPSRRCTEDLYTFLEHGNMPLDPDGDFYAYKAIKSDWMDKYTGTISNTIGTTVEVERNRVNDNPEEACSHGLHAGSLQYVTGFRIVQAEDRMIVVKINPRDVVSVPTHDMSKLRCCKYIVVQEYTDPLPETIWEPEDYDSDCVDYEDDEDSDFYDDED